MATQVSAEFFTLAVWFGICCVLSWFRDHAEFEQYLYTEFGFLCLWLTTFWDPLHFPVAVQCCPELSPLFL